MTQALEEAVGPHFSKEKILQVREKSWSALRRISESVVAGMTEEEIKLKAREIMNAMGASTHWHKINIRFAENTTLSFRENSKPHTKIEEGDIYYIDIGPVFEGFEGDVGQSFVLGKNERLEKLASDAEALFQLAEERWEKEHLSGEDLFDFTETEAVRRGWTLQGRHMSGHRLSDFPHAAYFNGILADVKYSLSPYAWVLEIFLIDKATKRGAFYEDLLVREDR